MWGGGVRKERECVCVFFKGVGRGSDRVDCRSPRILLIPNTNPHNLTHTPLYTFSTKTNKQGLANDLLEVELLNEEEEKEKEEKGKTRRGAPVRFHALCVFVCCVCVCMKRGYTVVLGFSVVNTHT